MLVNVFIQMINSSRPYFITGWFTHIEGGVSGTKILLVSSRRDTSRIFGPETPPSMCVTESALKQSAGVFVKFEKF